MKISDSYDAVLVIGQMDVVVLVILQFFNGNGKHDSNNNDNNEIDRQRQKHAFMSTENQ